MILSRTDPYGLRGAVKPGRLPETPAPPATRDKPENVRRCASCDVPPERCRGKRRSDADQERARAGGDGRKKVDAEAVRRLAAAGRNKRQIARELEVSISSVRRALKRE